MNNPTPQPQSPTKALYQLNVDPRVMCVILSGMMHMKAVLHSNPQAVLESLHCAYARTTMQTAWEALSAAQMLAPVDGNSPGVDVVMKAITDEGIRFIEATAPEMLGKFFGPPIPECDMGRTPMVLPGNGLFN